MLQWTGSLRWKHSPAELSHVNSHVIMWATFAVMLLVLASAFFCLKASWRSYCNVWIVTLKLIRLILKVYKISFIADKRHKQARQISTPVTSNVVHQALQVLSTLLCSATSDVCSRSRAALSPLSSSSAAALRLAVRCLQRRGHYYFKLFPHWNRFEAESRSI